MFVLGCLAGGGDGQMLQALTEVSIGIAVIGERETVAQVDAVNFVEMILVV